MAKQSKEHYVILTPRTDDATKKLAHHGTKWVLKGKQDEVKYTREPGPYLRLQSRDGTKCMCVKESGDREFGVRFL